MPIPKYRRMSHGTNLMNYIIDFFYPYYIIYNFSMDKRERKRDKTFS